MESVLDFFSKGDWNRRNLSEHLRVRYGSSARKQGQFDGCTGGLCLRSTFELAIGDYLLKNSLF